MMTERRQRLAAALQRAADAGPWKPALRGARDEGALGCTFWAESRVETSVPHTLARLREADLGPWAGWLRRWEVRPIAGGAPWSRRILCVVGLPRFVDDRAFAIENSVTLGPQGSVLLESATVEPDAGEFARAGGASWATVVYAGCRMAPDGSGCRVRRVIELELGLPLPARVERAILPKVLALNHLLLRRWAPPRELAARVARDPLYAAVAAHVGERRVFTAC